MALLAAYNFDESSGDFLDVTGGGHHIPLGANAARGAGHTGNALTKISTGLPVLAEPAIGQSANRTLMFWLRGTGGTWWVRWNSDALGSGAWGLLNLSGFACVQARDGAGVLLAPRPQVAIPGDGGWHHYAATYDGATVRLYLDGVEVSSGALAGGLYATADRVDVAEWSTAATFMDDLRIYDEALDQPTIATLMDTPVTAGGESHSGTVTLSASAAVIRAGSKTTSGAAGLVASAATTEVGVHVGVQSSVLPSTAALSVSGTSVRYGTVTLSAAARVTAAAVGDDRDVTVTATLAPQDRITSALAARRWTATLEAQP